MISSTQFLHYVVFKVRVPFDAEHLRLYAFRPYLSTTFLKFFESFLGASQLPWLTRRCYYTLLREDVNGFFQNI